MQYAPLSMLRGAYIRLRWAGHVARMEEGRSSFNILTGTPTGKRPLGRPRRDGRTILEWILENLYQYEELV